MRVIPSFGSVSGGEFVQIETDNLLATICVKFGDVEAECVSQGPGACLVVKTPAHAAGVVDVWVNETCLPQAFTYRPKNFTGDSDLTRLVRTLLQRMKAHLLSNISMGVALDYQSQDTGVTPVAELPGIVLSGPRLRENRQLATQEGATRWEMQANGAALVRYQPAYTVDLVFSLTAASRSTAELLNIMAHMATFLHRHRWIEMPRDAEDLSKGTVKWELSLDSDFRTQFDDAHGTRACTCSFVVAGFDLDENAPRDWNTPVDGAKVESVSHQGGDAL